MTKKVRDLDVQVLATYEVPHYTRVDVHEDVAAESRDHFQVRVVWTGLMTWLPKKFSRVGSGGKLWVRTNICKQKGIQ